MSNPFQNLGKDEFYEGSNLSKGRAYHDLPFPEYQNLPVHRGGTRARVQHICASLNVDGKKGLDIGCSVGGISFGLQQYGASMTGIDYDPEVIVTARSVEEEQKTGAEFYQMTVPSAEFHELMQEGEFDFVIWLSNWMWIAKSAGRESALSTLNMVSRNSPVMVFDCAQGKGDGMAGDHSLGQGAAGTAKELGAHTGYLNIQDLGSAPGGWNSRHVFLCTV